MSAVIFTGPTLRPSSVGDIAHLRWRPPVEEGDVYRAVASGVRLIGIIDGFFETRLAVWHKEILWALSQGVHVVGAASMGALRAAELDGFGMLGIGRVYESFRSGELTDDDEVAVAHAPADLDFVAVSDALVNIRFTIARAVQKRMLDQDLADALNAIGKGIFFKERSYPLLFELAKIQGLPADQLAALEAWIDGNGIDQKKDDAFALVRFAASFIEGDPAPFKADFHLHETANFHIARKRALG